MHLGRRPPATQRAADVDDAVARRACEQGRVALLGLGCAHVAVHAQPGAAVLQRAQRLAERLLERAPDGHDLAHRLHARRERVVGVLELLEREARRLHHAVVDARLEAGRRGPRDVVHDLGKRVADGQARGHLRDGKARRLRRERRRARDARVHLDDHHAPVGRVHRELHVRAAGLHAHLLEHGERRRAHALVFDIGERLGGRDRDRIARVHAHGVEVLDGAHDDAVAGAVAHDLHLEFLPALDALLHEHLADRRQLEALRHDARELAVVVGDAAAGPAERERRAQHDGIADLGDDVQRVVDRVGIARPRRLDAQLGHALVEELAVLAALYRLKVASDHLDAVALERAGFSELDGHVQGRLATERGQQRIGLLAFDDLLDELRRDGLDVGAVGQARVGHDGRRVAVHEHDAVALLAQHLARLRARVVELARLPDDDGARPDDEYRVDVGPLRHG